ncbi:hypothetical protein ACP70R_009200 [Stipagrostis hirtigluma subsp. patula]
MAMANIAPCGEFLMIVADLESNDMVGNVAAMNRASALIIGGMLPEPVLLLRLIAGLASNLSKFHHDITVKRRVYSALTAIRRAITSNHMNMDPSACHDALHAIRCCFEDEAFRRVQRHGGMVRVWTVQEQLIAVRIICIFLRRSPVNITDARCVTAFASLMLSPHINVVCACATALLSLPPVVPGFAFAVTRAYCNLLMALPPQSSLQIGSLVVMLNRLKQITPTMVDHPGSNDLAMDLLRLLGNRFLLVRKKVLDLAVSLLTPRNVNDVLRVLQNEMDKADVPVGYRQMLQGAIRECHSAYPGSTMRLILDPKYLVFADCIEYIKDITDCNPLLRQQLVKCLLRALRHVKSSPVCAAALWAISVCSVSLLETRSAFIVISRLFEGLLDQREIEKEINGGGEVQHERTDYYNARKGDAQGEHQQPWLMEMEELLFVHMGLRRQADGSYAIASSSNSSTNAEVESLFMPSCLERTDNLAFLVWSGDALLADFVEEILSELLEKAEW